MWPTSTNQFLKDYTFLGVQETNEAMYVSSRECRPSFRVLGSWIFSTVRSRFYHLETFWGWHYSTTQKRWVPCLAVVMGCGASTSKVEPLQVHEKISHSHREPIPSPPSRTVSEGKEPRKEDEFLPIVIAEHDQCEIDEEVLIDHGSSMMESHRPFIPKGMQIPMAPGRQMHKDHVEQLNVFLCEAEANTEEIYVRVNFKRDVHEFKLDFSPMLDRRHPSELNFETDWPTPPNLLRTNSWD